MNLHDYKDNIKRYMVPQKQNLQKKLIVDHVIVMVASKSEPV